MSTLKELIDDVKAEIGRLEENKAMIRKAIETGPLEEIDDYEALGIKNEQLLEEKRQKLNELLAIRDEINNIIAMCVQGAGGVSEGVVE